MVTDATGIQTLLCEAHHGSAAALSNLLEIRVCPTCGRGDLAVDTSASDDCPRCVAVCLYCGWRHPEQAHLGVLPQWLLDRYERMRRQTAGLRVLLRESLCAGAAVDDGPIRARLYRGTRQSPTWTELERLLEPEIVERLRHEVARRDTQEMRIEYRDRDHLPPTFHPVDFQIERVELRLANAPDNAGSEDAGLEGQDRCYIEG